MSKKIILSVCAAILAASSYLSAQVYSPDITKVGQVDTTNLRTLAEGIYQQANARTDREKAEAIWRFYLTDGRFVKPGMFYHIAGWAYEEPVGQVLDPVKLLNSYGFGLCYQDGPLMAATYKAGGFKDARVWFLTGHTVAEVFYDGGYHYFDSDMMGYNPTGNGPLKKRDVASVYQMERDPNIVLKNVTGPKTSNPNSVDYPWYPADVHANAMKGLTDLFTTTNDNYLYAYARSPQGHTMDFVLRPGESMTRYFAPAHAGFAYVPYQFNGHDWQEVPEQFKEFNISTTKGPHSEKDSRMWATGKIEYRPAGTGDAVISKQGQDTTLTFSMPSPYVIIDASMGAQLSLPGRQDKMIAETSADGGHTWNEAASISGPFNGPWQSQVARLTRSASAERNAVTGSYGYEVRFLLHAVKPETAMHDFNLTTLFQLNPRTLPALTPGDNTMEYHAKTYARTEVPVRIERLYQFASKIENADYWSKGGQGFVVNLNAKPGDVIFTLTGRNGGELRGFDVGGRFLDLRSGIAPDKFTAEVRKVKPWPANSKDTGTASISWATSTAGPWKTIWTYDPKLTWLDHQPIPQVLRWPEVDHSVRDLPAGTKRVYVRYSIDGLAIDQFRLATIRPAYAAASEHLKVTHVWKENGAEKEFHEDILRANDPHHYQVMIPKQASVTNVALILECPAKPETAR